MNPNTSSSPSTKPGRRILQIILLVSTAHALVHLLEQSLASVEEVITDSFEESGWLGLALRLPYGIGAVFAGMLADRFGSKRILVVYLLGAGAVAASIHWTSSSLMWQMMMLGSFASMYHPAGLALLANETTLENRSRALGMHGVFGSLGIAAAPFLAGAMFSFRPGDWRGYYLLLGCVSIATGIVVWLLLKPTPKELPVDSPKDKDTHPTEQPSFQLVPYALLVSGAALGGMVYSGTIHFLPRYLNEAKVFDQFGSDLDEKAIGNYAAALALICGAAGQWVAGRLARPERLPAMLCLVYAANVPFLLWMTVADGPLRLVAACLWAFFHFMNQPVYNSLLPEFLSPQRRSSGFGFSAVMGFGVGALGPPLFGLFGGFDWGYPTMAGLALIAALLPLPLVHRLSKQQQ
ncbi:MAG TPA: hypothetical protein DCG12_21645 [Planctomycetaceae bacterium]|nr:hypothetical protein [Planctomycetaceae bacterium]